jgi:transcription elongation GreA/GreB family factor
MESMENRIEELEGINEKSENELALLRKNQQGKTESKIRELEN